MKRSFYLSSIASLALLLTACEKADVLEPCTDHCTTIAGRLLTAGGKAPLAGANVVAHWNYRASWGYRSRDKAGATTDAAGRYQLSFYIKDEELQDGYFDVTYGVDKQRYYVIGENKVAFQELGRDTLVQVHDYIIPRLAHVQLAITNADQLAATHGQFLSDFSTCYGFNNTYSPEIRGGGPVIFWDGLPTENPLSIAGDQPILARHYRTTNGIRTTTTDSLLILAGTTSNYTVSY